MHHPFVPSATILTHWSSSIILPIIPHHPPPPFIHSSICHSPIPSSNPIIQFLIHMLPQYLVKISCVYWLNPSKYSHCKPLFKDDKFVYLFVYLFVCLFVVSMYPFIHPNISNHIHWFSIIIINQNTMNESPISSIEYLPLTKFAIENFLLTKQTHWMNLPSKIYHRKLKKHTLNESQPNTHIAKHTHSKIFPIEWISNQKSPLQNTHIANLPLKIPIEWIYHQKSTIENFPLKTHTLNESQPKISTKNAIEKHTHSKIFPIEKSHWEWINHPSTNSSSIYSSSTKFISFNTTTIK